MSVIRPSSKQRSQQVRIEKYHRERRQINVDRVAKQKEKMANYQPNDIKKFHLGEDWFNNGMKLEEAPEELRNNHNFVNGFERAKRIQNIALQHYEMGVEFYKNGVPIEQIPEKYKNNYDVIKGYNDTLKKVRRI